MIFFLRPHKSSTKKRNKKKYSATDRSVTGDLHGAETERNTRDWGRRAFFPFARLCCMFTFCCLSYWFDVFFFNNFFHSSSQYVSAGDNNVCVPPFDPFFPDLADFDFGPNCPAIVRRRRRPCVHLCLHPTKRTLPPIVHRSFTYATFRCRCSPLDALPSAPFPTPPS